MMGCELTTEEVEHIDRTIAALKSENDGYAWQLTQLSLEVGLLRKKNTELLRANDRLRELVRDYVNAPCTTCDCWDDNFRCWNYDGADCGLVARARELGVEVD